MNDNFEYKINRLIENGYSFNFQQYLSEGLALYKQCANTLIPFSLLYFALIALTGRFYGLSLAINIFVSPCVIAGYYLVTNKAIRGEQTSFDDCMSGFRIFSAVVVINLIVNIIVALGYVCLIIPGIYLTVAYTFASLFVIFFKIDYRTAMRLSRQLIHKNWWEVFGFVIVTTLIGASGALLCGFGIVFTLPLMYCMIYVAFEDIVGKALRE